MLRENVHEVVIGYVCVLVCLEDASNIWCKMKAAVASIGSVCIQRPIKLCSHGDGVTGRDSGCKHCLYIYLSILTQTGLNMNTVESFFHFPFLPSIFVFHRVYFNSFFFQLPLSENIVTHFPLVLLISSLSLLLTWFVCFTQYPHVPSL